MPEAGGDLAVIGEVPGQLAEHRLVFELLLVGLVDDDAAGRGQRNTVWEFRAEVITASAALRERAID